MHLGPSLKKWPTLTLLYTILRQDREERHDAVNVYEVGVDDDDVMMHSAGALALAPLGGGLLQGPHQGFIVLCNL